MRWDMCRAPSCHPTMGRGARVQNLQKHLVNPSEWPSEGLPAVHRKLREVCSGRVAPREHCHSGCWNNWLLLLPRVTFSQGRLSLKTVSWAKSSALPMGQPLKMNLDSCSAAAPLPCVCFLCCTPCSGCVYTGETPQGYYAWCSVQASEKPTPSLKKSYEWTPDKFNLHTSNISLHLIKMLTYSNNLFWIKPLC